MFGFSTIVAFVIAWFFGGWWWLLAIFMLLMWSGIQENKRKATSSQRVFLADSRGSVTIATQQLTDSSEQLEKLGNASEWVIELTQVCSHYSGMGYYVSELIPEKKLRNALKAYPPPGGGRVVALIDTTLFGAADDGMLIGENGLSWHNFLAESKVSSMSWDRFSKATVSLVGQNIHIGSDGAIFETLGTSLDTDKIFELLRNLQVLYNESTTHERRESKPTFPEKGEPLSIAVNLASHDSLLELPGIGVAEAMLILGRCDAGEYFSSVEELAEFLNLKPHKAEQLRNRVTFLKPGSPSPSATPSPSSQSNSLVQSQVASHPKRVPSQPPSGRMID